MLFKHCSSLELLGQQLSMCLQWKSWQRDVLALGGIQEDLLMGVPSFLAPSEAQEVPLAVLGQARIPPFHIPQLVLQDAALPCYK